MGHDGQGALRSASTGGVTGDHPAEEYLKFPVGPSTADQFNRIRLPLTPIACWRVDDVRFAFDSSFVAVDCSGGDGEPEDIRQELQSLKSLVESHPGCPLTLFGHADPVGDDVYNKALSERRARAVYGLLIFKSEPSVAVSFWRDIAAAEHWGEGQQQAMQTLTGSSSPLGSDLIGSYLQQLSQPGPVLAKTDFLGQGTGPDRKGDFQGCSEFNPVGIFSQTKQTGFDQAKSDNDTAGIADRNSQNACNRRVLALMFKQGSKIDPSSWPCPRATEGIGGCKKRFWSDGEARRSTRLPDDDRRFSISKDTFACRFYQRYSGATCEQEVRAGLRLIDELGIPLANTPILVTSGENSWEATTDGTGLVEFDSRVPIGSVVQISVIDTHEMKPGEAIVTPSGQHFKENGP